jgi:hypothetical protein
VWVLRPSIRVGSAHTHDNSKHVSTIAPESYVLWKQKVSNVESGTYTL